MEKHRTFIFDSYRFDKNTKTLVLRYSYDNKLFFDETLEFPTDKKFSNDELVALDNVFKYLHLAAGVSYYKLFVPPEIVVKTMTLNKEQAEFFNNFYRNGLGEFSYRNNITDLWERIKFPYATTTEEKSKSFNVDFELKKRIIIPIGGGKDSAVTLEVVGKHYKDLLLCSIGIAKPIEDIIKISGRKYFRVYRTIPKTLLDLNKILDVIGGYNGHIPISGIVAFILVAASIIYEFDTVLMSNERSANVGNVNFNGITINHQWSKSLEFEKSINIFVKKYILDNFNYISFLRPLSEIHIAKLFANFTKYHGVFVSCNSSFKIEKRVKRWCCNCPKCRFAFLILSVYIRKNELTEIFGKDMLDDERQLYGFMELCGLENHKPFECVGEVEESVYAMLNTDGSFNSDCIVKKIRAMLKDHDVAKLRKTLFTPTDEHMLTNELSKILNDAVSRIY
ncbi:hypothetical protein FACS1894152_6290 [Bacilli bacterium]|nr:hypothetical protein FACS1894152_6290 [Bacilli bacterium]